MWRLASARVPALLRSSSATPRPPQLSIATDAATSGPYDVAVVGAGLAGTALAALLSAGAGTGGLRVAHVSPSPPEPAHVSSLRVIAVAPNTKEILASVPATSSSQHASVWDDVVADSNTAAFDRMQVWSDESSYIRFDSREIQEPALAWIAANDAVQGALARASSADVIVAGVTSLQRPSEADPAFQSIVLSDGSQLQARLVVGADGASSVVARDAGIQASSLSYAQRGVVARLEVGDPQRTAWQRFLPSGPIALLPLPGPYVSLVWSTSPEHAKHLQNLAPDAFVAAVNSALSDPQDTSLLPVPLPDLPPQIAALATMATEAARTAYRVAVPSGPVTVPPLRSTGDASPWRAPPLVEALAGERASFPLQLRLAHAMVAPRIALLGDAAHVVHPMAGQGANLGIADAVALADSIALAVGNGGDIGGDHVLHGYQACRMPANLAVAAGIDVLKRVFDSNFLAPVRNLGTNVLAAVPGAKDAMMRVAMAGGEFFPRPGS